MSGNCYEIIFEEVLHHVIHVSVQPGFLLQELAALPLLLYSDLEHFLSLLQLFVIV